MLKKARPSLHHPGERRRELEIVTPEGLGPWKPHPIQQAFIDNQAAVRLRVNGVIDRQGLPRQKCKCL
jgi:hypothetical protein